MNFIPKLTPRLSLCLALGALLTIGCDDDEPKTSNAGEEGGAVAGEMGGDTGGVMGGEMGGVTGGEMGGEMGGVTGGEMGPPNAPLSGEYYMSLFLAEFSLVMPFKLTFVSGYNQFDSVSISAIKDDMVSEPMKTVEAVALAEDQRFEVDFGEATLPGAFSPTGTDVVINLTLTVEELREASFCGQITGEVVTFMQPVTMSTFAAYPWGEQGEAPASACVEEMLSFEPIETCPELTEGLNEGFTSAEIERSFKLVLPDGYDPSATYPLLFAYHGLGGSIEGFLEQSTLDQATAAGDVILVVPESQGLGAEWESGLFGPTRDLAFFDDMLTCVSEQYGVDPAQVHVTGHSAGTFFSAALSLQRDAVLASTSLVSAGMSVDYRAPETKRPFFFLWGGEEDSAYDQDFHLQTTTLIDTFSSEGHPVVYCDHSPLELLGDDSRHSWPDLISSWIVEFIHAHPQGVSPLPYAEGTPEAWTGDCGVR